MSCFSPPDGYLVGKVTISISVSCAAARSAAMPSGLLSSTPIKVSSGLMICRRIFVPSMISSARSRIRISSAVI